MQDEMKMKITCSFHPVWLSMSVMWSLSSALTSELRADWDTLLLTDSHVHMSLHKIWFINKCELKKK